MNFDESGNVQLDVGDAFNLVEYVWYYHHALHLMVPELNCIDVSNGVDTSILNKLNTDVNIDTMYHGKEVYIRVLRRTFPESVGTTRLWYTMSVEIRGKESI